MHTPLVEVRHGLGDEDFVFLHQHAGTTVRILDGCAKAVLQPRRVKVLPDVDQEFLLAIFGDTSPFTQVALSYDRKFSVVHF